MFLLIATSDHISPLTGATPSCTLSKAGGSFGAAGGTITEVANGWYKIVLTTTDTNTVGDLVFHITATSGDPTDFVDQISPTIINDITTDGSGNVSITSPLKKNTAKNGFTFVMRDSSGAPKTGLGAGITSQRSINGAGFASTTNTAAEVANGTYSINLSAADLNGDFIMLQFTATGAVQANVLIPTTS